jgi:hypothetical protein
MKRLFPLLSLVSLLCAADAPKPTPKRLQLWVSCVAWKSDGKPGIGIYCNVGESEDVMGPTVNTGLKAAFPKGYTIISMQTTVVSERMIDELVQNRNELAALKK